MNHKNTVNLDLESYHCLLKYKEVFDSKAVLIKREDVFGKHSVSWYYYGEEDGIKELTSQRENDLEKALIKSKFKINDLDDDIERLQKKIIELTKKPLRLWIRNLMQHNR